MFKPGLILRLLRFGLVGGIVMLVFMALNALFGRALGPQASFLLAYPLAIALHFTLSKWWTFTDRSAVNRRQVGEYIGMVVVTFIIQWTVFTGLMTWTGIPGWLAAGVANAVQMIVTFIVMQRRVFRGAPAL